MKPLRITIRIGADHDDVTVASPAGTAVVDRSTMKEDEKRALASQLVDTWKQVHGVKHVRRRHNRRK